jgi:predicted amidohydrolase YtcJ
MQIFYNARIYTLDQTLPIASAMAIERERILAVGQNQAIFTQFGVHPNRSNSKNIYNLNGHVLIPGLIDAHIHLQQYALGLQKVDCETSTREECLHRVSERARSTPHGEWILGHGWDHNRWPEGYGNLTLLDAVSPEHPVYLTAKSLHAAWINSLALQRAGINAGTSDPQRGRIQRDGQNNPTGILFENALPLVTSAIPEPSSEQIARAIIVAQTHLWKMGITAVHDFDRISCFSALQILHMNDKLRLRVLKSIPLEALPNAIELGLRSGFGDDFLRIGSVKIFSDGALGPHTAAMLQPYEGELENRGMLFFDAEQLFEHGRLAIENGLSLAVHAIGDAANHEVLNAYAQLRVLEQEKSSREKDSGIRTSSSEGFLRHRIEHVQIIHPDDTPRLAALKIIASMQPIHATSDFLAANRYWGKRSANAYAWRSLLDQGTKLTFGSDAPVESPNPFWGIHAAVTRRRHDGSPGPNGWYPNQRITVHEALSAYSIGAAFAAGMEKHQGKLAPGYLADFVVLDTDPFTCETEQIKDIHPLATMVAGNWVFGGNFQ